jgi:hypothetical protein
VSDITGVTGMVIVKAIEAGECDPQRLAQLRNPHYHHDADDVAKALQGSRRAEHLFALRQAVELYEVTTSRSPNAISRSKGIRRPLPTKALGSPYLPRPAYTKRSTNPGSMPVPRPIAWQTLT